MFSFIRKRLASADRTVDQPSAKTDDLVQKSSSEKDIPLEAKKKTQKSKKKKEKSSSTLDELVIGRNPSTSAQHVNQPYSEVDYVTMMPSCAREKTFSKSFDSLSDSYLNPAEVLQTQVDNYLPSPASPSSVLKKRQVIEIPVEFVDRETGKDRYRTVDHPRTGALNYIVERRIQQRLAK